jgi:antitoxin HigA-1
MAAPALTQRHAACAGRTAPGTHNRIAEIVHNRRRIAADTALRPGLYFGNSPEFWMNPQTHYDLKMAPQNLTPAHARRIKADRAA